MMAIYHFQWLPSARQPANQQLLLMIVFVNIYEHPFLQFTDRRARGGGHSDTPVPLFMAARRRDGTGVRLPWSATELSGTVATVCFRTKRQRRR